MATQVVSVEPDVTNGHLGLMGVQCRVRLREAVALEHVEHGSLACVVETQEDNISAFLEKAEPLHGSFEEIYDKHFY
jgi:hypothetical protein